MDSNANDEALKHQQSMMDLLMMNVKWFLLYTAIKLNLIDHLSEKEMSCDQLAEVTNSKACMLKRVLVALKDMKILEVTENELFKVTSFGSLLKSDHMFGFRNSFLLNNAENVALQNLSECVKTGHVAFEYTHGMSYWEYLIKNHDENKILHNGVDEVSAFFTSMLSNVYDLKQFDRIVDIRCCGEKFITSILNLCPEVNATVLVKPELFEGINDRISRSDISKRCLVEEGHFLDDVPSNGDCYIINLLLHDWSDADCNKILQNIRQRMKRNAKVLIIETLRKESATDGLSSLIDIVLMTLTTGKTRNFDEISELLKKSGFANVTRIETNTPMFDAIEASG